MECLKFSKNRLWMEWRVKAELWEWPNSRGQSEPVSGRKTEKMPAVCEGRRSRLFFCLSAWISLSLEAASEMLWDYPNSIANPWMSRAFVTSNTLYGGQVSMPMFLPDSLTWFWGGKLGMCIELQHSGLKHEALCGEPVFLQGTFLFQS